MISKYFYKYLTNMGGGLANLDTLILKLLNSIIMPGIRVLLTFFFLTRKANVSLGQNRFCL